MVLCRRLNLFSKAVVAVDGSKFKAVNNRDKNFTAAKVEARLAQVEASIGRYLAALDRADREPSDIAEARTTRLNEKIAGLREQMQALQAMSRQVEAAPDGQVSLIDPDARSMATSGKGTGMVGYNVQAAVDAEHHLIVAHAVTNVGSDRAQLAPMGLLAQEATGCATLTVLADRGYLSGEQVLACEGTGVLPCVPKTLTSGHAKRGLFTGQDFVYDAEQDHYTCPAGQHPTVTTANRGELAVVTGLGGGERYDILFRMLEPHELAAAMGFNTEDARYEFTGNKTQQIKQIGNAVSVAKMKACVSAIMADAAADRAALPPSLVAAE